MRVFNQLNKPTISSLHAWQINNVLAHRYRSLQVGMSILLDTYSGSKPSSHHYISYMPQREYFPIQMDLKVKP